MRYPVCAPDCKWPNKCFFRAFWVSTPCITFWKKVVKRFAFFFNFACFIHCYWVSNSHYIVMWKQKQKPEFYKTIPSLRLNLNLFQDQHLFQILLRHHHNLQTSRAHQRARAQPQRVQARGLLRGVLVRIILKNSKQTKKGLIRKNSKQTKRGLTRKNSKQTKRGRIQRLLIPEVRQGQQPEVEIVVKKWKLNGLHPEMNLMSNLSMA